MAQTGAAPPGKCDGCWEEFASRDIRIILFPCSGSDRVAAPGSTMLSVIEFRALMLIDGPSNSRAAKFPGRQIHGPSNSWAVKIHGPSKFMWSMGARKAAPNGGCVGGARIRLCVPHLSLPIANDRRRNCDAPSISAEQDGAWVGGLTDPMLAKGGGARRRSWHGGRRQMSRRP